MRIAVSLASALALSACQDRTIEDPLDPADELVATASTGSMFHLTDSDLTDLTSRADAGDADAAFRIAQHYSWGGGTGNDPASDEADRAAELRWLRRAVKLGHPYAGHNLRFAEADDACRRTMGLPDSSPERRAAHRLRQAADGVACDRPWKREVD